MEGSSINYLTRIPDELKIAIFSYLDIFEVMQLCDVSAIFQDIVFDKDLISKIRVYKDYRFTKAYLNNTILTKARMDTITSLNINCVYWIPAADLRNCIYKLHMLQCLYVVDTELSLNPTDCDMYSALSNLKTIALTVTEIESFNCNSLPETITELYLHLEIKPVQLSLSVSFELFFYSSPTPLMTKFLKKLKHLQKLWIIDFSMVTHPKSILDKLPSISSSLKKLTFTFPEDSESFSGNLYSLVTMFRSNTAEGQICLEKCDGDVNPIYWYWNSFDPMWDKLINGLKRGLPFCQNDARKLILKQTTVQNMQFSELNLAHNSAQCSEQLKSTLRALLVSSNMKLLKKLSVNICLCEQTSDDQPLSKRTRTTMMSKLPNQCTLEKVIKNSPLIEELEIWECGSVSADLLQVTDSALSSIQNLKHLRKLTIQGLPKHLSGEHLLEICKSCTKLESLRIQTNFRNDYVNTHLCTALVHTTALKDFRYEQDHIPIDKIVDSLNKVENSKLERLLLKCQTIQDVSLLLFELFLSTKHQLRFLCILVNQMSQTLIEQISTSMKNHTDSSEKIFVVAEYHTIFRGRSPIPHIHKVEMLRFFTWVSALDIFNGFENY